MKQPGNNHGSRTLIGLFGNRKEAEKAYSQLAECGYPISYINVVMSDSTRKRFWNTDDGNWTDSIRPAGSRIIGRRCWWRL